MLIRILIVSIALISVLSCNHDTSSQKKIDAEKMLKASESPNKKTINPNKKTIPEKQINKKLNKNKKKNPDKKALQKINKKKFKKGNYYNKELSFSINFPKNWERKYNYPGIHVIAISPYERPQDVFKENISIYSEQINKSLNLDDYNTKIISTLRKQIEGFSLILQKKMTIHDLEGRSITYTQKSGATPVKVLQYIFLKDRQGLSITCTASIDNFNYFRSQFKKVVSTFRFH